MRLPSGLRGRCCRRAATAKALFPILWLHTMCLKALATDGTAALHAQHVNAGYRDLLEALGLGSRAARAARVDRLYHFLPQHLA